MIFLTINLQYTLHFFASLLGGTLLYHRSPLSWYHLGKRRSPAFPLDCTTERAQTLLWCFSPQFPVCLGGSMD